MGSQLRRHVHSAGRQAERAPCSKLHYTDYNNEQDDKGSWYYPNMFQPPSMTSSSHHVPFTIM